MDWNPILTAVLRKAIFALMLICIYMVFDRGVLRGFKTEELLKNDPKAVANLLGAFAIAVSLA